MDHIYDQLDFYYPLITILVILLGNGIKSSLAQRSRYRLAKSQRSQYFRKISEEKKIEESVIEKRVQSLKADIDELKKKISQEALKDILETKKDKDVILREIEDLEEKRRILQSIKHQISEVHDRMNLDSSEIRDISAKIENLEKENNYLKSKLDQHPCPALPPKQADLDPALLDYLDKNKDEATIDFLKNAYDNLLEMKISDHDRDLDEYISQIKKSSKSYENELTDLELERKKLDKKLEQTRRYYQEELNSFIEQRLEYQLKITGAQELLSRLEEKNNLEEQILTRKKRSDKMLGDAAVYSDLPIPSFTGNA